MYEIVNVNDIYGVDKYNSLVSKTPTMVLFYMDGCGHCEMMKPIWRTFESKLSRQPSKKKIMVAKINEKFMNMVDGYKDIIGFPTIYYLEKGKKVSEFTKERTLENFEEFLKQIEDGGQTGGSRKRKARYGRKSKSVRKTIRKTTCKRRKKSLKKSRKHKTIHKKKVRKNLSHKHK